MGIGRWDHIRGITASLQRRQCDEAAVELGMRRRRERRRAQASVFRRRAWNGDCDDRRARTAAAGPAGGWLVSGLWMIVRGGSRKIDRSPGRLGSSLNNLT